MVQKRQSFLKFLIILTVLAILIIGGAFLIKKSKSHSLNSQITVSPSPKVLLGTPCRKDVDCGPQEKCSASASGIISAEGREIPPIAFCKAK